MEAGGGSWGKEGRAGFPQCITQGRQELVGASKGFECVNEGAIKRVYVRRI